MFRRLGLFAITLLTVTSAMSVAAFDQGNAVSKKEQPKFKAIWEPVSFNQDIELRAITCTTAETCWAVGAKSTILHTTDGGRIWHVQLGGDPQATDDTLDVVVFADATHGWALGSRGGLLTTTDGENWSELDKMSGTSKALWFTTGTTGFVHDNSDSTARSVLRRTADGGKSWKNQLPCSVATTVDGLARTLGCLMLDTHFVSPQVGYMGGAAPINMGTNMAAVAKTTDGGTTWVTSVIPESTHRVDDILFWSETEGLVVLQSGQAMWTGDGGATWTGSTSPPAWSSHYAAGSGRMVVGVNQSGKSAGYSFNGGRSFSSRPLGVPAQVRDVTFADATHGYLVGQHGMVYRYRIVPVEYKAAGMIAAAAPPQ